ncbi:MAG: phenylalanine--tRNA ligase subunit alpha [Bacteroidales bacterium]|nr:phenylalanine--tRNA ligase subunit alpha [Bacteroidales bacterium]
MIKKINELLKEVEEFATDSFDEAEEFRIRLLSKKGQISLLFNDFKALPPEEKKLVGQQLNTLKESALNKVNEIKQRIEEQKQQTSGSDKYPDLTLPVDFAEAGSRHPISIVRNQINGIFEKIGFVISEGPEIENDWHNFSALNFAEDHPARDMQDTFFVEKNPDVALRTHTSSVQVRVMNNQKPPIRTISPGRVFRNEAISARAHCIFHQVEGLYIDKGVSFADLKHVLDHFAREFFGPETKIRLRPSYFPFTEPSAEVDVSCPFCKGKGCNICKGTGWVEIMGCGMVDPNVLENCNIDSTVYTGYAFGMGIERITMLKYMVNDLRLYFENDLRFLRQFSSAW